MEQVKRIASALVLLPPLVLCFLYASPGLFLVLVLIVIGLSLREYFHLLQHVPIPVCPYVPWLAAFALAMTAYLSDGDARWLSLTLFLSMVVLTLSVMLTASQTAHFLPMLVYSVFGVFFIAWTLSHLILLRGLPAGQWYMLFLCAVVWVGDSAAMYIGKSLGQHKMAPAISPGKTWEGAIGWCRWQCGHRHAERQLLAAAFATLAMYRARALYCSGSPAKRFGRIDAQTVCRGQRF